MTTSINCQSPVPPAGHKSCSKDLKSPDAMSDGGKTTSDTDNPKDRVTLSQQVGIAGGREVVLNHGLPPTSNTIDQSSNSNTKKTTLASRDKNETSEKKKNIDIKI